MTVHWDDDPYLINKEEEEIKFEANFTIPETVATGFHNNRKIQLMQMLQLQIKFGVV